MGEHVDSIITWVGKAANVELSTPEKQASSARSYPSEVAEVETEKMPLPHSPQVDDELSLSEEPEAMAEERSQIFEPKDSGHPPDHAKSPSSPIPNDQDTPTEQRWPKSKQRQSTSVPSRRREPVIAFEEKYQPKIARASGAWFDRYRHTLGTVRCFHTNAKDEELSPIRTAWD
ncbi:hypothetical protein BDZ45DRAFT_40879 [Acephala macrosclerotiorum]|nr:hypothetical protein BDZ45DRAFT_40879 [Acephala macrosclerotiorum]